MITMSESFVVRNTPALGAARAELTHCPVGGYRARHDCPDGGQWIGPAQPDEGAAWSDGIRHERACERGQAATREGGRSGVQTHSPGVTFERCNGRRETDLPKGEPCS
jgi:hypothetical protein